MHASASMAPSRPRVMACHARIARNVLKSGSSCKPRAHRYHHRIQTRGGPTHVAPSPPHWQDASYGATEPTMGSLRSVATSTRCLLVAMAWIASCGGDDSAGGLASGAAGSKADAGDASQGGSGASAGDASQGGSGTSAGAAGQDACTPKTCLQLGAACGMVPDTCGGTISCGTCAAGQECGGGGPNQCGTGTCSPKTCAQLGASCGSASDGCSGVLDCGTCPAGQECSTSWACVAIGQGGSAGAGGSGCTPSWSCGEWSACACSNTQSRTCTDKNGCGTSAGKPSESSSCDHCGDLSCNCGENWSSCPDDCECTPSWSCTSWSTCSCTDTQTRTCTDQNGCGTSVGMPSESQSCDHCGNFTCDCGETETSCPPDCSCLAEFEMCGGGIPCCTVPCRLCPDQQRYCLANLGYCP